MSATIADGTKSVPYELQRARLLSQSLDASAPQRMTATAQTSGAWC